MPAGMPLQPAWAPYDPNAPVPLTGAERTWVPVAHWLALFTTWLGPLVVLLTVGESSPRVREHAKESLNFEVTFQVLVLIVAVIMLQIPGTLPVLTLAWPAWIALRLWATTRASAGKPVRYPLTVRIVR